MKTTVYNRWGNIVYQTENIYIDWAAKGVSTGIYYWIVEYSGTDGKSKRLIGDVTIIR